MGETEIQTTKQVIADIEEVQVDADDIRQIIEIDLVTGTARDVTQFVAIEVWREFDCNNLFAWKEMREWLESFGLDCDHLTGETKEIRHFYG
jgi:adenylate cyclase class IV